MKIIIRKATKEDAAAMYHLIKELAEFENAPNEVSNTAGQLAEDGFQEHPLFHAHVAEADGKIVGIALYYIAYSTWKGKYVYLDDLIVTEAFRRHRVGKRLFDACLQFAHEQQANQLRWHVLNWNTSAIKFYEKYNCSFDDEWITCKLTGQQIKDSNNPAE